ncbi:sensor histidine kinase [Deinococcus ficus]|uniref:sensor histidine kinase n=1 Tax=Deinococcus ficus TaxID=317577 RepID=UPI0003B379A1|nr:ATP-binding protein [Deinococcus ficus]
MQNETGARLPSPSPAPAPAPGDAPRPAPTPALLRPDATSVRPRGVLLRDLLLRPFLLPFVLLLGVGAAVVTGVDRNARATAQVNAAHARLVLLSSLARDTSDMESGQRGYVITGHPDFLKPYLDGVIAFQQHAAELENQAATEQQRTNTGRALAMMNDWREFSAEPEITARQRSLGDAVALVANEDGKSRMEALRALIAEMRGRENVRLSQAVQAGTETLNTVRLLAIAGLLTSGLTLLLTVLRGARRITTVLDAVNAGAQEIAAGQYDTRLPHAGVRELDALSGQVHVMARAVQDREAQLAQAAQTLETTNEQLRRSNRELEQFAYVASHDLQEPLRTIGSYTELLAKRYAGQLDERADRYIAFTTSATARLKTLIQDLLAFSRVRQGQEQRTFAPVDTRTLAHDVVQDLHTPIQEAGAAVEFGLLPILTANADLLRHVFQNLIANAVKFRGPARAPVIRVSATREPGRWVFHVQDNGIGIEPQYFERIFGVFQRLHTLEEYSGSGIGLAVARSAIEQHGGDLWLDSTPGEGSTFHFSIPDHRTPAPSTGSAALPGAALLPAPGPRPTPPTRTPDEVPR